MLMYLAKLLTYQESQILDTLPSWLLANLLNNFLDVLIGSSIKLARSVEGKQTTKASSLKNTVCRANS